MDGLNILVIDDNHDLADGLGMILEDEGHKVALAYNGAEALSAFDNGAFDLVFIDVKLPDMSGIEVFQAIYRKKPETRIFMITGYRIEQLLAEVVDNGSVEVLRKPCDIERLDEALHRVNSEGIILIADDDPECVNKLSAYLSDKGIRAKIARDRNDVVGNALKNTVEVLVLDLHKPITYALEAYLELKQHNNAVKTIIVICCEDDSPEITDVLRSSKITGCLFKPFDPDHLLNIIETADHC